MKIGFRKYKGVYIVDVEGDMDLYSAREIKEVVSKLIDKGVGKIVSILKMWIIWIVAVSALLYISILPSKGILSNLESPMFTARWPR